jgi:two-component system, chemotaxis family, sensor kinase CheA
MSNDNSGLIPDFIAESKEGLAGIEGDLLTIEADGANASLDLINKVFRAIHSMKGASSFLGLTTIGALAHAAENVLSLFRSKELVPNATNIESLLLAVDRLKQLINDTDSSNAVDVGVEVAHLKACIGGPPVDVSPAGSSTKGVPTSAVLNASDRNLVTEINPEQARHAIAEGMGILQVTFDLTRSELADRSPAEIAEQVNDMGTILAVRPSLEIVAHWTEETRQKFDVILASILDCGALTRFFGLPSSAVRLVDNSLIPPVSTSTPVPALTGTVAAGASAEQLPTKVKPIDGKIALTSNSQAPVDASIRVSIGVLDRLMNLAGELVLGRNQLLQAVSQRDLKVIDAAAARLDQVTTEMQESIMQTRMQPIGNIFQKFTRIIRDLSNQLGKKVQLQIEGGDVELDKTIIEAIGDPLTHLIRNAVDHGIERPSARQQASKPEVGTVVLKAFHLDGKVNIVIQDDGAGIDAEKVKRKAVEKGLISADEAESLSERDAVRLIFHPGFSLADKVTEVSGRGVGMDVVRTNFEKLGGVVEIDTCIGQGSTFNIRLPLTLAIIPSLIVRSAGQRFAIPQVNILELVRLRAGEVANRIRRVNDAEVLQLRGSLLPLVRLACALGVDSTFENWQTGERHTNQRVTLADRRQQAPSESSTEQRHSSGRRGTTVAGALNIIVLESGRLRYGLVVDALQDSEEIVVKPLGRHLQDCRCLAGATVLGDGCIAMILDVVGIAEHTGMTSTIDEIPDPKDRSEALNEDYLDVLLFQNSPDEFFGVPTSFVARIERISLDQIDSVANREVLQYRGGTLELISVEQAIVAKPRQLQQWTNVVVFSACGREIGLIAPKIFDIRRIPANLDTHTFICKGLMGSTTIDGKVTRILDTFRMMEAIHPEWVVDAGLRINAEHTAGRRVLLAEDSDFFRTRVMKMLEEEGYEVTGFPDGATAWEELNQTGHDYDLVVTDIEMPKMSGLQLCQRIRSMEHTRFLPVIALSSLSSQEDQEKGAAVGVTKYLVKLDRELLLGSLAEVSKQFRSPLAGRSPERTAAEIKR